MGVGSLPAKFLLRSLPHHDEPLISFVYHPNDPRCIRTIPASNNGCLASRRSWIVSASPFISGSTHRVKRLRTHLLISISACAPSKKRSRAKAQALRRLHEEPLKQLQGHAEYLTELSRNLQALVADLRLGAGSHVSNQGSAANWPLDRVVNLHDELRRTANGDDDSQGSLPADSERSLARRVHRLEAAREQEAEPQGVESHPVRPRWVYVASAAGAIAPSCWSLLSSGGSRTG